MTATNLRKNYAQFSLHIPHMEVSHGQIYGIVGANGCGKSTLAALLAGTTSPDSGIIDHCGLPIRDITLVPQKSYLLRDSVIANLIYPLKIRKMKPHAATIDMYLELAGLKNLRNAYAPSLSSGEAQKLALIRAMIFSPKLVIADEALSNMDMESQARFEEFIMSRQKQHQTTWIVISHQLATIKRLCGYVFFMHAGKIEEENSTAQFFGYPKTAALEKYLAFHN